MTEALIEAQGLSKRFRARRGWVEALRGIDLTVLRGETFGLIGPDGAGKTTAVRVILGLLRRSGGVSRVLGHDSLRDPFPIREQVGYISQQFALAPDLTVAENMRFFADMHQLSRRQQRQRIGALLEFAGLGSFESRLSGRLSGGMKKKLALACSLIHSPKLVVLDEPTLGVDPVSRREFWALLGDLRAEQGLTILVCTPYMDEAERCNRVGLMYQGRLVGLDTPAAIKASVPGELLEFTPSDMRVARASLTALPGILEVQTYGMMLHLFVDRGAEREPQIVAALAAQGIAVSGMRRIAPRMEEAFVSLMRERGDA